MKRLLCLVFLSVGILSANDILTLVDECNKGDFKVCNDLGERYVSIESHGLLNTKAYVRAKDLWSKACDGGVVDSCFGLGVLYYNGQGVRQDKSKSKKYYDKACELGNIAGCAMYEKLDKQGY